MSGIVKPLPGAHLNLDHPLARGLVACWLANEGSGNKVHDHSGQWNTGTLTGAADPSTSTSGWAAGPHGGALNLDGTDDFVAAAAPPVSGNQITVVAWIKAKALTGTLPGLLGRTTNASWNNGFGLYYNSGALRFFINHYTTNVAVISFTDTAAWHQVVGLYDGANVRIFLDGVEGTSDTLTGSITSGGSMEIGRLGGWSTLFNGLIGSVSIYDRALPVDERAQLYAFPYAMFDDASMPAWMMRTGPSIAVLAHHYNMRRAA